MTWHLLKQTVQLFSLSSASRHQAKEGINRNMRRTAEQIDIERQVIGFLQHRDEIKTTDNRSLLLFGAGLEDLGHSLDFAGPSARFATHLVKVCSDYGPFEDGRLPLEELLLFIMAKCSPRDQAILRNLLEAWKEASDHTRQKGIVWVHLSDFHFRETHSWKDDIVLRRLFDDLEQRQSISPDLGSIDFIAITGDIAFSGTPGEYVVARDFLDELSRRTEVDKDFIFMVPGNHDLEQDAITPLVAVAMSNLTDEDAINEILCHRQDRERILSKFTNYRQFAAAHSRVRSPAHDPSFGYAECLDIRGANICIVGLNSAWLSPHHDDRSRLAIGEYQVVEALRDTRGKICIALMHHPFDWLQDHDRRICQPLLAKRCHFILHGHVQRSEILTEVTPDTDCYVIGAGPCHSGRDIPGHYNMVHLELETGRTGTARGTIFFRKYSHSGLGFWAKDTLTYRNAPDGIYRFDLSSEQRAPSTSY
jgi:hypothetical protein